MQHGALVIARELFPGIDFLVVESPDAEQLERTDGVIGLGSIAPRFSGAIARLREAAPERLLTIGGTCGVEAAPVAYLNERYAGDLAVVWLDAHGDLNTPASSPSGNFHGMVLRTLLGDGPAEYVRHLRRPLQPRQVFLAATRDLDRPEQDYVARAHISVTPPEGFSDPQRLVGEIRGRGFTRVYLHLDLDALDPAGFSGMLIPTSGGPAVRDLRGMLEALSAAFDVAGASIVEYVHGGDESLRTLTELRSCFGPL